MISYLQYDTASEKNPTYIAYTSLFTVTGSKNEKNTQKNKLFTKCPIRHHTHRGNYA